MKRNKINNDDIRMYFSNDLDNVFTDVPTELDNLVFKDLDKQGDSDKEIKLSFINFNNYQISIAAVFVVIIVSFFILFPLIKNSKISNKVSYTKENKYIEYNISSKDNNLLKADKIVENNIITTTTDSDCTLEFADSSTMILDNDVNLRIEKLRYNDKNSNDFNEVHIVINKGLVAFNIKELKNKATFIVETKDLKLFVLGTKFVAGMDSSNNSFVAVEEGKVKIIEKKNIFKSLMLHQGKFYSVKNKKRIVTPLNFEVKKILRKFNKNTVREKATVKKIEKETVLRRELKYNIRNIFSYNDKGSVLLKKVIGFAATEDRLVAVSEECIVSFDLTGKMIWEKYYGKNEDIFFMSCPVIYNDKVIISSLNQKLLILDLYKGNEIKRIKTNGNLAFGYNSVVYNNYIFIPYENGLYKFNPLLDMISEKPVIPFTNPVTPLVHNNSIIISSFIEKKIASYKNNRLDWQFEIDERSFNRIKFFNNSYFIGDNGGNIYRLSPAGKLEDKYSLDNAVLTEISLYKNQIYTLTKDGFMNKINLTDKSESQIFMVDKEIDYEDYLFKSQLISDDKLFIGNRSGEVIVYDLNNEKIIIKINTRDVKISSSIFKHNYYYFFGNENGNIYIME